MGKLYGIGVGAGDPELLTLKAYRILKEADVVFCPEKKEGSGSFAYDIVKEYLKDSSAEIVNLTYPMHYHGEQLRRQWRENAGRIAACLSGKRTGAFITLGDPAVYSTFLYTLPYLEEAGIETEVVSGIPSFCAAADSLKLPLVAWDENLLILPVRKNSGEWLSRMVAEHDNLVFMKPSSDPQGILKAIRENHCEDKFVLITKSGTDEEHMITDFETLCRYEIPYLSMVIIKKSGKVME